MAAPTLTYTLTNGQTADASQVMQNLNDLLNGITDGTKDLTISALTVGGVATLNGAVNLGNGSVDDITWTGSLASSIPVKTDGAYDLGSATAGLRALYFGDGSGDTMKFAVPTLAADWTMTFPNGGGTNGTVLKNSDGAGTATWSYPYLRLSKAFADTPYTLLSTTTHLDIDTSGGAVTVTVPAASSTNSGQTVWIRKTTADFSAVTLATGVSTTLNTIGEMVQINSNGTAWVVVNRTYPTTWTSYTPATVGFGTISSLSAFYRRNADGLEFDVEFASGTVTATEARVPLPGSLTSQDTGRIPILRHVGTWQCTGVANAQCVMVEPSTGYVVFAATGFTKLNGTSFGSSSTISFKCVVPITGWNA